MTDYDGDERRLSPDSLEDVKWALSACSYHLCRLVQKYDEPADGGAESALWRADMVQGSLLSRRARTMAEAELREAGLWPPDARPWKEQVP